MSDRNQDKAKIKKLRDHYDKALNDGDTKGLTNLFTEDAVMMPPDEDLVVEKEQLFVRHEKLFKQFSLQHTLQSDESVVCGDWAFDRGTYAMTLTSRSTGLQKEETGKYLTLFRKERNGQWLIARDMWNQNP
jgi:uncharacterized protein (TIGR02246 family)